MEEQNPSRCHSDATPSMTSSHSSGINSLGASLSTVATNSEESLATALSHYNRQNEKPKSGVKHFLRRVFTSTSSNVSRHQEVATVKSGRVPRRNNIGSPSINTLPNTQGPIRLFVVRHGERLDRYYSSRWLQQAFDEDGHFCRFSPILP